MKVIDNSGKVYSDQTGHSLVTSSRGNTYTVVLYGKDMNEKIGESVQNKEKK